MLWWRSGRDAGGTTSHPEQLTLDLDVQGLPPRRLRRPSGESVQSLSRVLVSLVVGVLTASAAVTLWPYRSSVAGVSFVASASVTPSRQGLTMDTSLGALQFRDVTVLPLGLHVTPRIDLSVVRAATAPDGDFTERVRSDLRSQAEPLMIHFAGLAVTGLLVGSAAGDLLVDGVLAVAAGAVSPTRRRRFRLARDGLIVTGVTAVVTMSIATVALLTYQSDWYTRYSVTGVLADVAATPARLSALDTRDNQTADKIRAVLSLQDALTKPPPASTAPPTAFAIMFISDVHRRDIYPYLQQYIDANDVKLIVDTGDETLFGKSFELTRDYLASIRKVTSRTPMVWVKGNHDSAEIARAMAAIPGVTVLDGTILPAFGLQIYGTADPRVYGAAGDLGSDDPRVVTRVETQAAADALSALNRSTYLDLLLAHEPVEADSLATALGPGVRAQASGHVHHQNAASDLQRADQADIRLIEGTTGMGGLLANNGDPMEFSIMSVATNCQFTRIVRYQLQDPALPTEALSSSFGTNSSFAVHYFHRQQITGDRICSTDLGITNPVGADSRTLSTLQQWATGAMPNTTGSVQTPTPANSGDEAGDKSAVTPTATSSSP